MVWLQILATVVVCGAIIADVAKNNSRDDQCKIDCESCDHLIQKNRKSLDRFRYYCAKHRCFDKAPLFCTDYRKRSEEE